MYLFEIIKKLFESPEGGEYLCIEYRNEKGELISAHTHFWLEDKNHKMTFKATKSGFLALGYKDGFVERAHHMDLNRVVRSVENNVVIFENGAAFVFYVTKEINMEKFS